MPVDKVIKTYIDDLLIYRIWRDKWIFRPIVVCSSRSQALKFSKAIKALVEKERKR